MQMGAAECTDDVSLVQVMVTFLSTIIQTTKNAFAWLLVACLLVVLVSAVSTIKENTLNARYLR